MGCMAVAFGQVFNYFNYPSSGNGYVSYCNPGDEGDCREVKAEFYKTQYDYDNMPDKFRYGSTDVEINAVSTLLSDIGAAARVKYGKEGSSAQLSNPTVFKNLKRAFNMVNAERKRRGDYSKSEWAEMIKTEIRGGSPVILTGQDNSIEAGHAYILDGLNEEGQVHINFGWGGNSNGYQDLDNIIAQGRYKFTDNMYAYMGLRPTQHGVGEKCGGKYGEQCGENLKCVLGQRGNDGICESYIIQKKTITEKGSLAKGEELKYGPYTSTGASLVELSYENGAESDADLYVQLDKMPTKDDYLCRPYKSEGVAEVCEISEASENIYVKVVGFKESTYTLKITTYVESA